MGRFACARIEIGPNRPAVHDPSTRRQPAALPASTGRSTEVSFELRGGDGNDRIGGSDTCVPGGADTVDVTRNCERIA